jgi:hypothetical protein
MKTLKRGASILVHGLLFLVLGGLLVTYLLLVSDLPARVYTVEERAFLAYNDARRVAQLAPTWNVVLPGGDALPMHLPGQDNRVRATLVARQEERGGVSVTTYDLDFRGEYRLAHTEAVSTTISLFFPFPRNLDTLHEVRFTVDGAEPAGAYYSTQGIRWETVLEPEQEHQIEVSYRAGGANSFSYGLQREQRADVDVVVRVDGLTGSDVPGSSLPASAHESTAEGEVWTWHYPLLIADRDIRLDLPTTLSFAQRVAALQDDYRLLGGLAPLLTGGFLASLAAVLHLSSVRLRVTSYLLIGCGLALFYPLLTFLSGTIALPLAAALALVLVSALVLAFLGWTAGWRATAWQAGLLLAVFLGLFSLGVLTPWRGLLFTAGGLLLLGTFMVLYARHRASLPPEPEPVPPPEQDVAEPQVEAAPTLPDVADAPAPAEEAPPPPDEVHCPYCARRLAEGDHFCPNCGHDTGQLQRCAACGRQQLVPAEIERAHCLYCGEPVAPRPSPAS